MMKAKAVTVAMTGLRLAEQAVPLMIADTTTVTTATIPSTTAGLGPLRSRRRGTGGIRETLRMVVGEITEGPHCPDGGTSPMTIATTTTLTVAMMVTPTDLVLPAATTVAGLHRQHVEATDHRLVGGSTADRLLETARPLLTGFHEMPTPGAGAAALPGAMAGMAAGPQTRRVRSPSR